MGSKNKISRIFVLYFLIFLAGCITGYIYEEIFYLIQDKTLVNRGFLYGPYLPVYGFGAILIVLLLDRLKKYPLLVFILSMLLTGIVEYITGIALYEIYHKTWWDYNGLLLNIGGYVCIRSVFTFAIGGILLIYIIKPQIIELMDKIKLNRLKIISIVILLIIVIDFILSILIKNAV